MAKLVYALVLEASGETHVGSNPTFGTISGGVMPVYEYECIQCGKIIEKLQKVSNGKCEKYCPICSGKMKKIISKSTFHLKGTGWYATDYNNKQK